MQKKDSARAQYTATKMEFRTCRRLTAVDEYREAPTAVVWNATGRGIVDTRRELARINKAFDSGIWLAGEGVRTICTRTDHSSSENQRRHRITSHRVPVAQANGTTQSAIAAHIDQNN